jgi:hypothetical protein
MPFKNDSNKPRLDMDVDFASITEHQRYKLAWKSSIHAGCGGVCAPQSCMSHQRFDPIVYGIGVAIAERFSYATSWLRHRLT